MQQRNKGFDIAKGIAIYMVVLGHLLEQIGGQDIIVISFSHMPVFFFISGYFMRSGVERYTKQMFIKRKVITLLFPYFVWSLISFLANVSVDIFNGHRVSKEFVEIFIHARSCWFLVALFMSMMLFVASIKIAESIKISPYIVALIIWMFTSIIVPGDILSFYKSKWLFPFLLAGYGLAGRKIIMPRVLGGG